MSNEKVTQLPTVTSVTLADILYLIQAGVSSQCTVGQVVGGTVQTFPGNPNGNVAGNVYTLLWDTVDDTLWVCTASGSILTAVWTPITGALTNGQVSIGSTGNAPVAATLTAGANITITNTPGGITIASTGTGGFSWNDVTGTTQAMLVDNGYMANNAAAVTLALPTTSVFGSTLSILGQGAGGWIISQAAGQQIFIGNQTTSIGVAGSLASTNQYDSLNLLCTVANTIWTVLGGAQGNITVV